MGYLAWKVDERIHEVPDTSQTGIKGKTAGMMISLISLLMALGCFACVRAKDKSLIRIVAFTVHHT